MNDDLMKKNVLCMRAIIYMYTLTVHNVLMMKLLYLLKNTTFNIRCLYRTPSSALNISLSSFVSDFPCSKITFYYLNFLRNYIMLVNLFTYLADLNINDSMLTHWNSQVVAYSQWIMLLFKLFARSL